MHEVVDCTGDPVILQRADGETGECGQILVAFVMGGLQTRGSASVWPIAIRRCCGPVGIPDSFVERHDRTSIPYSVSVSDNGGNHDTLQA